MVRPPFAYFGGKTALAGRIIGLLPAHRHYVEPFGGSLAVLLAKRHAAMETANDIDGDLVCFWRVLRDHAGDLVRGCALTPHSRIEFDAAASRPGGLSDLERARRVWVRLAQSRSGHLGTGGWRYYVNPAGSTLSMPEYLAGYVGRLAACAERLALVSLECRPALELVERYGSEPDVLLYVDPPYLGDTRGSTAYPHEMRTTAQHSELAAALRAARAAVVVSGYASGLYDSLYGDWHTVALTTGTGRGGRWSDRTERLWSNRPLLGEPLTLFDPGRHGPHPSGGL